MKICILIDTPNSWIHPYGMKLKECLVNKNFIVEIVKDQTELPKGDIAFFLGCTRIVKPQYLERNKHNIVIHPSDLPQGRGFSPLAWQILEGKNSIPVTLFEANAKVDDGPFYIKDNIQLEGWELNEEIKKKQGEKVIEMCENFLKVIDTLTPRPQVGKASYYPKRGQEDSRLDVNKTIAEQFNLLRVVDNSRYPAFFLHNGRKYTIKIEVEKI